MTELFISNGRKKYIHEMSHIELNEVQTNALLF